MIQLIAYQAAEDAPVQYVPVSAVNRLPVRLVSSPAGGVTNTGLRSQMIAFQGPSDGLTGNVPVSAANPLPVAN